MVRMHRRHIAVPIAELAFAEAKMAFVSGPRQVGKTTLAQALLAERGGGLYANWDDVSVRRQWAKDPKALLPAGRPGGVRPLLVLDEIHKVRSWKRSLKGLFDVRRGELDVLVTGSARLNVYRKGSDSLLGRYLSFRMHPLSVRELGWDTPAAPHEAVATLVEGGPSLGGPEAEDAIASLLRLGGFPEPLLRGSERLARLWRRGRVEKVIREDLRDLTRIPEVSRVEMLAALLPERVGSALSVAALREDLEVAHDTVTRWLGYLKELFYVFDVRPWTRSVRRSLRKEGKAYLWDWSEVEDEGARFENLVASHLLKSCDVWTDTGEGDFALHTLRDKEKREIDFLVVRDKKPFLAIEAKLGDASLSPAWRTYIPQLKPALAVQIVRAPGVWRWHEVPGGRVLVASAAPVLSALT